MTKSIVSMQSIADELGITKNTVSVALRGLSGVSDDVREKVVALADAKGYSYKKRGESSLSGRTMLHIVMLYRKALISDRVFWPAVLSGVAGYAADKGISLSYVSLDDGDDGETALFAIKERKCDGILVVNDVNEAALTRLAGLRLPMVVLDYHSDAVECDYVNTDNCGGIRKALRHLFDNNHSRIGFIGNNDRLYSFMERYDAFRYYMKEYGKTIDERFMWLDAGYSDYAYFREKFGGVIDKTVFPTAWICVNDAMTGGLLRVLDEFGYKVPEDVSVVGFDNVKSSGAPLLTTVDVQKEALGRRAAEQLTARIENPEKPYETLLISTALIVRDSVRKL